MKIDGKPIQSNIDILKNDLAEHITKIKIMEDTLEQGKNYGLLIVVVGLAKYKTIIMNPPAVWNKPKDPAP